MKVLASVFVLLSGVSSLFAQSKPPALMPGLGQHHHMISTKSPKAQRFFDQGRTLVSAFNHEEAGRSFRRASELDPQSAMGFWGVALAIGPCIKCHIADAPAPIRLELPYRAESARAMPLFLSSLKAAHPVNAPIAPFHVAIQRIVLLLDEAVDAPLSG
jgi:hypothetical protein